MQTDEQEIRQLVTTWLDATKSGDYESLAGLMADDIVFMMPGCSPLIGKEHAVAAMKPKDGAPSPQVEGHSEIQELVIQGELAYMWTKLSVIITPPGANGSILRAGNTLSVLKKINGKWLLARDANMLVTVQAPPQG